jgi:hypothetical protein
MTLRDRCKAFNDKAGRDAIMRTGDPVENLTTFVTNEVNTALRSAMRNGQKIMQMRAITAVGHLRKVPHVPTLSEAIYEIKKLELPSPSDPPVGIIDMMIQIGLMEPKDE